MLNMIRMDLYRMFRTKSMYVIWLVLAAAVFFTTSMSKLDMEMINEEAGQTEWEAEPEEQNVNFGMAVFLPTKPGEKVTVADQVYANLSAKFIAVFLVIFAVLFAGADVHSGYIKNIGGQVRNRGKLIFSKAAALFVFTAISMLLYFLLQIFTQKLYFGYLEWGNTENLLKYLGVQLLLHYALILISMAVAVILNSSVFSITIAVCLCMNVMTILYGVINRWIWKAGAENFRIIDYTVTGKIALLPMAPANSECLTAVIVAVGFCAAAAVLAGLVFRRRDV